MDISMKRLQYGPDGIFSELSRVDDGERVAVGLEHAYSIDQENWHSKIPAGVYKCDRGTHRLEGMDHDFETFEITGVTGHTKILFHVGNYNHDSAGCVLLGAEVVGIDGHESITLSRVTFQKFMDLQNGIDSFQLTVLDSDS